MENEPPMHDRIARPIEPPPAYDAIQPTLAQGMGRVATSYHARGTRRGSTGGRNRHGTGANVPIDRPEINRSLPNLRQVHRGVQSAEGREVSQPTRPRSTLQAHIDQGAIEAQNAVWPDVDRRLVGHLRFFTHGVRRTPDTIASLMQKASAWLRDNKDRIGVYDHPGAGFNIAARCCDEAFTIEERGQAQLDMYGDRDTMRLVADYNQGVTNMTDPRDKSVGWGWWALTGLGAAASLAALGVGKRAFGLTALTTCAVVGAGLAVIGNRDRLKNGWADAWRLPA
jgi:hypothetical protein